MATSKVTKPSSGMQFVSKPNVLTFSSSQAAQSVTLSDCIGCELLSVYTNNGTQLLSSNSQYVKNMGWNPNTGGFSIERNATGYFSGATVSLVLLKAD